MFSYCIILTFEANAHVTITISVHVRLSMKWHNKISGHNKLSKGLIKNYIMCNLIRQEMEEYLQNWCSF
jgi:hypothetical protein